MHGDFSAKEPLSYSQEIQWMSLPQDYAVNRIGLTGNSTNQL